MAVRREAPTVDDYIDNEDTRPVRSRIEEDADDEVPARRAKRDVFEEENEDEIPARSSIVQQGWAAAKKQMAKQSNLTTDFRFTEEVQVVKFLSGEPILFKQHWLDRKVGRKSYVCLGDTCPLCRILGDNPSQKFAFSIINLDDESMASQMLIVGTRLCNTLEKLHNDPKTGPLEKNFWALSKTGAGQQTAYTVTPIKERDLAEDWDVDPDDVAEVLKTTESLGADAIRVDSKETLTQIARELAD